ncbi:MAG: CotH kinase family protein [Prevotella sp.]|nr:CotH kinase family protein [Prevotella sp.]
MKLYNILLHTHRWRPLGINLRLALILPAIILSISLSKAQETFEECIQSRGLADIITDWSDSVTITLPMPTCAYVNITGTNTTIPTRKDVNYFRWLEIYDGNGNYFKKRIITCVQGQNSTSYPKRNFKLDFCEDEWVGDETPDITFGNWVTQDAFHLKAFYNDLFKGIGIISYRTYDLMTQGRGETGRIWERAGVKKPDPRALCHPDAFPVKLYFNGEYYGQYCWQLKKHRKNMNQKKNTPEHIHIEGRGHNELNRANFFLGNIVWNHISVRTPKDLYDMDGNVYDEDLGGELMDETSPYYDLESDDEKTRERKQNSAKVKKYLQDFADHCKEVEALVKAKASSNEIRAALEEFLDVTSVIDYMLHNLLTVNWDGVSKNYQWLTYDGKKWFVVPYDLDNSFGYGLYRILQGGYYNQMSPLSKQTFIHSPTRWVYPNYKTEMWERWAWLRDQGIINSENLYSLFDNWYYTIGESSYAEDYEKWPKSYSLKPDVDNEPWHQLPFNYSTFSKAPEWDAETTYEKNSVVKARYRLYQNSEETTGVRPYKQTGHLDSLERIHPYLVAHVAAMDRLTGYTFTSIPTSYVLEVSSAGWSTLCIPFRFALPEGMTLYAVDGRRGNGSLILRRVDEPEAYKPYLVEAAPGRYLLTGYTEEPVEDDNLGIHCEGSLCGVLAARFVPQGGYVLQVHNGKTGFYRVKEDGQVKMGANRAWLETDDSQANYLTLDTFTDGIATTEEAPAITDIHDMRGVRIDGIQKGLNIIRYSNGKTLKVMR